MITRAEPRHISQLSLILNSRRFFDDATIFSYIFETPVFRHCQPRFRRCRQPPIFSRCFRLKAIEIDYY
jgi:hypothetical protein